MKSRVVVTGLGAISALGEDCKRFWSCLKQGEGGIRPLEGFEGNGLAISVAAQVSGFDTASYFAATDLPLLDRYSQLALIAAREAVRDASLTPSQLALAGAVIGTGCGGKETDEETYQRLYRDGRNRVHPLTIPRGMPSAAASQVSIQLGIKGGVFTVASACASANHAIVQAVIMIRSGLADIVVAGGTDAPFTYGLLRAWEALRVLSRDTCRPFSANRSGLVLGEGAGIVVLENLDHARARGARIHAELAGVGMSADSGHITAPSAEGAARAMRAALDDAGLYPEEVEYINAHGTGTQANDITETAAIRMAFGKQAERLAVSSTKSMHGHALGAAGGLELVATIKALQEGIIPPTINFTASGEGCDLDYVPNEPREIKIETALSNSFAFGGLNAVLAVKTFLD